MATYSFYRLQATPSASPKQGHSVLMRQTLDFYKQNVTSSDVMRAIPINDHWVITNCWYRVRVAHAAGTHTVNIGTADNGTQIASAVDMTTAGDWVQGTIGSDTGGGTGGHSAFGADGYVFVSPNHNLTSGILEVMVEVVAMPGSED